MDLTIHEASWELLSTAERREKIMDFEAACKAVEDTQGVVLPPREWHCAGVYARELMIPKGTALVGEIHLHDHINVVSAGSIRVATEEGVKTITAPSTFVSKAGTKRAGYALEDTVWTLFHATTETDEDKIRAEFIAPTYEQLDRQLEQRNDLGSNSHSSVNRHNHIPIRRTEEAG